MWLFSCSLILTLVLGAQKNCLLQNISKEKSVFSEQKRCAPSIMVEIWMLNLRSIQSPCCEPHLRHNVLSPLARHFSLTAHSRICSTPKNVKHGWKSVDWFIRHQLKHAISTLKVHHKKSVYKKNKIPRPLVMSVYQKIFFLISQPKHMLWVLKRTVTIRQFFWAPKIYVKTRGVPEGKIKVRRGWVHPLPYVREENQNVN